MSPVTQTKGNSLLQQRPLASAVNKTTSAIGANNGVLIIFVLWLSHSSSGWIIRFPTPQAMYAHG